MTGDPGRIANDTERPALAALLRAAEADVLDDGAVERVRVALAARVAAGGGGAGGAARPGVTGWAVRLGAPLAVAVAAAVALRSSSSPPPVAPDARVTRAPAATAPATTAPATTSTEAPPAPDLAPTESPSAPPVRAVTPATPSPKPVSPAREGTLLLEARRALTTDPTLALQLVEQHEREFPASQLAPERARIREQAERGAAP